MQIENLQIKTVEMHTGGEPVRIVTDGYPPIPGATILAKRAHALEHLDHLRRLLMFEPRGHYDMYGALLVEPDLAEADLAVLFMHNEGYSTMCGHAVIALGRFAVDRGLVRTQEPETRVAIQCPCGLVRVAVEVAAGRVGRVRFESVPAFAFALDRPVETAAYGPVLIDIGYGGAFYALATADQFGLDVRGSRTRDLVDAASAVTEAVKSEVPVTHPDDPELGFLYGTILTDGGLTDGGLTDGGDGEPGRPSANICVFADAQVDRSPTGSGVTARLAVAHRRKAVRLDETHQFESVTGARFSGRVVGESRCGPHPAVTVEVAGQAFYTGEASFTAEADDPLKGGFLLR